MSLEGLSMIKLKVTKIGNSTGVVLPKEALARLKVEKGDALYLVETPDGYRLSAYDEAFGRQMRAAERVMRDQRDVLRELAK
jgi:putative addiction module antidote